MWLVGNIGCDGSCWLLCVVLVIVGWWLLCVG